MNMNEPDFENQLRALRPLAPSASLEENIARELTSPRAIATVESRGEAPGFFERIFPGLRWAFAGAAGAAAVLLAMGRLQPPSVLPATQSASADFETVEVTRDLVAAEDGGLVYEDEDEPARLVRYTTIERHVWTHPGSGARLEVEIPREDVVIVPIAMQ